MRRGERPGSFPRRAAAGRCARRTTDQEEGVQLGDNRTLSFLLPWAFFIAVLMVGCKQWSQRGAKGVGVLPKAAPGEQHFSSYQPKTPYTQLASGLLTRTLYEAPSGEGYRVEVRELLVGPGQHTDRVTLPGAAILEVRSGSGILTVSDKPQELRLGATFSLAEAEAFAIENTAEVPLALRVHLVQAE